MNIKDAFNEIRIRVLSNRRYIYFVLAILMLNLLLLSMGIPVDGDPRIGPTPGVPPP